MTYPSFNSGEILTASDMNAVGLWLVKTQTVGTGVTSVDITSCFSSTYDNYKIAWSNITFSTNTGLYCTVLNGTTPITTGWYGNTLYMVAGSGGAISNAGTTNGAQADLGGVVSTSKASGVAEIQSPNLAASTLVQYMSPETAYIRWGMFAHNQNTAYTGLRIAPYGGTMTGGTIRVYGYRN